MASMRKLRRRLLRWKRHDARVAKLVPMLADRGLRRGHYRAAKALDAEESRRFWAKTPEIWLGGSEGEAALIADVLGCCLAGNDGHDGPCVIRCDGCTGNGRCPECGGLDDLGCWHCDGTGGCPEHCDDGEIVLEEWFPRGPSVVTVPVDRGVL